MTTRSVCLPLLALLIAASGSAAPARDLTFDERVQAQEAIERVYWAQRIWPSENAVRKPPFDTMVSPESLRAAVDDYLRKSSALEVLWSRPVTAVQLQAEVNRMAETTRDPATLRALFAALHNDPVRIAECLGRAVLADRLVRNYYGWDARLHADVRSQAEQALAAFPDTASFQSLGGVYSESTPDSDAPTTAAATGAATPGSDLARVAGQRNGSVLQAKAPTPGAGAMEGPPALRETDVAFQVYWRARRPDGTAVESTWSWSKVPFETWWNSSRDDFHPALAIGESTWELPVIAGAPCQGDHWWPMGGPPDGRSIHAAVWTGAEMIVWGGTMSTRNYGYQAPFFSSGGRYDPATDTWRPMTTVHAPAPRAGHTAVWTGREMIVWGGWGDGMYGDGARYDPATDRWTPMSTIAGPSARYDHVAAWTGQEMIIWGAAAVGGRYTPSTDSWEPMSTVKAPVPLPGVAAVWTGREFIVYGGHDNWSWDKTVSARYDPALDRWTPTSQENWPGPRAGHVMIWTGNEVIVWGGVYNYASGLDRFLKTGRRYDPGRDVWTDMSDAPEARNYVAAAWTGHDLVVWGGANPVYPTNTGLRYDPGRDTWSPIGAAGAPAARENPTAVWTGSEMIVWGGDGIEPAGFRTYYNTGGRFDPASETWVPTASSTAPPPTFGPASVWTGVEMVVWGGVVPTYPLATPAVTGGLYEPATNRWRPTSLAGAPEGRSVANFVWDGREVLMAPFQVFPGPVLPGAIYDPVRDTWRRMTETHSPSLEDNFTAVWTGSELLLWNTWWHPGGAAYSPASDSWRIIAVLGDPLPAAQGQVAVWSGDELLVWGGQVFGDTEIYTSPGYRINPTTGVWKRLSTVGAPTGRRGAGAIWASGQMLIWGGRSGASTQFRDGGRYDPSTDTWRPIATLGAPTWRQYPTGVWTGREWILWGDDRTSSGGRYDPVTDTWVSMTLDEAPPPRAMGAQVWTGRKMLVWGGRMMNGGGAYDPCFIPNSSPGANAGPSQTLECIDNLHASTTLDGSASTDPDSTPGTNDDIVSFDWSEGGVPLAAGMTATVPFHLGAHDVTLTVTDKAGAAGIDDTMITVRDTIPPTGAVTSPIEGQCFGPSTIPVMVTDSFKDVCDPTILRTYSPPPGPLYSSHGDHHVAVTAMDTSGNAATAAVDFTIDTVPPVVQLLSPSPSEFVLPRALPFVILFKDGDDDGAAGGVIREVVKLQGCPIYDGATYGNEDGLLSDETLQLDITELCRIAVRCGFTEMVNPELRVEATDCGGNVGFATRTLPGSIRLIGGVCGQSTPAPVRRVSAASREVAPKPSRKGSLAPR